jgi:uncharacterized membrane protein YfcA
LSLASRLLGVVLCLAGGWTVGGAQGVETVSNAVGKIAFDLGVSMNTVGAIMGAYVGQLIEQQLTPNYGTDWVFGILVILAGFILIARGDRKPRNPRDKEPLLTEPLYGTQRD